ncbi:MAG: hypothetical protein KL787_09395 [Taibaiella sp.]|nr:hypothetical protein [Taibaiella sp.]
MEKRILAGFSLIFSLLFLTAMQAPDADEQEPAPQTFLNDKISQGGIMSADSILYFLDKPLFSQDTAGNFHQVLSFLFTYIERDIYINEDGKPYIGTEIGGTNSNNGIVPEMWRDVVRQKIKSGDTVIFNNPLSYLNIRDESTQFYSPRIVLIVK